MKFILSLQAFILLVGMAAALPFAEPNPDSGIVRSCQLVLVAAADQIC